MKLKRNIWFVLLILAFCKCNNSKNIVPENMHIDRYTKYVYNDNGKLQISFNYDIYKTHDSLHSVLKYTYDKNGNNIRKTDWRPESGIFCTYIYEYDSINNTISQTGYGENNKMNWKYKYVINNKKECVSNLFYNKNSRFEYKILTFYNIDGESYLDIKFDSLNNLIFKDSTFWINKNKVREVSINDGKISLENESTYDSKKNLIKRVFYDSDGKVSETLIWDRFNDGREKSCKFFDNKGNIKTMVIDKYNSKKQLIKEEWYEKEKL